MKKVLVILAMGAFFASCGASETKVEEAATAAADTAAAKVEAVVDSAAAAVEAKVDSLAAKVDSAVSK
jgi:uncharacterized lipoprotein YajG